MTNIEWTDATWNPVIGCAHVAEGCRNCYAEKMSKRLAAMGQDDYAQVLTPGSHFNGKAIPRPATLAEPLRWRKPRKVFVNSMSDLFHKDVPFAFIAAVYGVMAAYPQHTFQILTKRPERMLEFMGWMDRNADHNGCTCGFVAAKCLRAVLPEFKFPSPNTEVPEFHLPNVWHGTSVAEQKDADKNIPLLLKVPSAVRFISAEPLIGPVTLERPNWVGSKLTDPVEQPDGTRGCTWLDDFIDWVIVGGESGPGARPCDVAWIRSIVDQCKAAGVPCFVKQLGAFPVENTGDKYGVMYPVSRIKDRKGGDPSEWPADLRVREFPATAAREGAKDSEAAKEVARG